jgi:hypothetical protein
MGSGRHSKQTGPRPGRTAVGLSLVVMAILITLVVVVDTAPAPSSTAGPPTAAAEGVPYQFVAKAYTELLGRAPTAVEWTAGTTFFEQNGCTVSSLRAFGDAVISTDEYRDDYPPGHEAATALTLYRFVLNREPAPAEFVALRQRLASDPPVTAAQGLFDSAEFATRTEPAVCDPTRPGDAFGEPGDLTGHPEIPTPSSGTPGPDDPEPALQLRLDDLALSGGGTLALPAGSVTGLTTTLTVPGNVTLTTAGDPDPDRYADMAQLVRLPSFTQLPGYAGAELVSLAPGAHLVHLWVDGQRYAPDPHVFLDFDIRMLGGVGTTVADDRIGDPSGATDLEDDAGTPTAGDPAGCSHNVVSHNLVEGYATSHTPPAGDPDDHTQADGLGILCGSTTVADNDIVDVSDAAIVLFNGGAFDTGVRPQLSTVVDNTIISAGNSMYFGIATDPFYSLAGPAAPGGDPAGTVSRAFAAPTGSAVIEGNHLWTGERTHIDVLLSSGSHDLFGSTLHQDCLLPDPGGRAACGGGRNATGATWTDNTSDGQQSWAEMGVYVGGTDGAVFTGNRFPSLGHVTGGGCPKGAVVVASGTGPTTDFAGGLRIDQPVTPDPTLRSDRCVTPGF